MADSQDQATLKIGISQAANHRVETVHIDVKKLRRLEDLASLWKHMDERPCFISFYTGANGNGYALREVLRVPGSHHDKSVERKAERMARKLGANSWLVFKPVGMPSTVYYRDEEDRLELMERGL